LVLHAASKVMGAIAKSLFRGRFLNDKDKGKVFVTLVMSMLLYGCESWVMTKPLYVKLRNFFNTSVRRICRHTHWQELRCQHLNGYKLRKQLGICSFDDYYVKRLLSWARQLALMPMWRLPRKLLHCEIMIPVEGGMATWKQTLRRALQAAGQPESSWMFRAKQSSWKKATRSVLRPLYSDPSYRRTVWPDEGSDLPHVPCPFPMFFPVPMFPLITTQMDVATFLMLDQNNTPAAFEARTRQLFGTVAFDPSMAY
jgi:hypothetical protein